MRRLKKHLKHFLIFSFVFFAVNATSSATPDSEVFPPLPYDQELPEDFFPDRKPPVEGETGDKAEEERPLPPKDADSIIKYRGNRTYSENLPLKLIQTRATRTDNGFVSLELSFNQSINPRSVRMNSILINNNPLAPEVRFAFNRKGNTIKVFFPMNYNSFKIKLLKIRSFNGNWIEPVEFLVEVERSL